jgi:hypothetical protein
MNIRILSLTALPLSFLATGCVTTCGPGTIETDGDGWKHSLLGKTNIESPTKICLPVSPVSDCTTYSMKEEDGGGWGVDRDGGGHRVDRDGGGHRVDRDGSGVRKERDEPHHPKDAGDPSLGEVHYFPAGYCRIGVRPRTEEEEDSIPGRYPT